MKYPNELRECPHGWTDCSLCANLIACQSGEYVPDPEPVEPVPDPIPELTPGPEELTTDLGIVIQREGGTWFEKFNKLSPNDRIKEIMRYPIPNLHSVADPYKAEQGAIVPGGGKSGRIKKSNKGTKIPLEPWTSQV